MVVGKIFINEDDRRRIITKWVEITLVALHAWGTMLVIAALAGAQSEIIATMFSIVTGGIGLTIGILLLEKAADVIIDAIARWIPKRDNDRLTPAAGDTVPVSGELTLGGGLS